MPRRLPYLPALDGLRAIAVMMVFAYHLGFSWASGGFLGVDVFFVISGYLITRLLIDEHADSGRVRLGAFWTRRFRRLVPAMVVMVAATLLAAHQWGLPEQWRSIRLDAVAAVGYVANWRFVLDDQSYFDASLGPSPLLHTWSLAVEEQWYLVWPLAMIGLCVVAARRRSGSLRVTALVLTAAAASALWMAWLFDPADPSRVYFGTDTRAQQLLIGAALAWLLNAAPGITDAADAPRWRVPFAAALIGLLVIGVVVDDEAVWLYRGGLLAISLLAAAVVLATITPSGLAWLGWGPLLWIGRRSYGIYLWHWPVIVYLDPATGDRLGRWPLVALAIAVTVALAELSHRLVEAPVRRSTAPPIQTVTAWSAGALAVAVVGFVLLTPPASRDLASSDAAFPELDELAETPTLPDTPALPETGPPPEPVAPTSVEGDAPAATVVDDSVVPPRRLLLFGDSAAHTLAEQFELPAGSTWDVQAFAAVGCPITPGVTLDAGSSDPNSVEAECADWLPQWPEFVRVLEPDVVAVMVGSWEVLDHRVDGTDVRFPSPEWSELVRDALRDAADAAATDGTPLVFLEVACMDAATTPASSARRDPDRVAAVNALIQDVAAERDDVSVLPLSSVICPDGDPELSLDGVPARYDGVHYTRAGAALVWPWLLDELDGVLDRRNDGAN